MSAQTFLNNAVTLMPGDCREVLATLPDASVDAIVCDPPYALTQASRNGAPRNNDPKTPFGRTSLDERGFMGKTWDTGEAAFAVEFWREALRVLKPGGHLLAFGGTRTYHRLACAIEDAGFEVRDCIMWVYGSGLPKSLDVSKALDKAAGAEREKVATGAPFKRMIPGADQSGTGSWVKDNGRIYQPGIEIPATDAARKWQGWGTALKPSVEPIVLARKPLIGTVAANVLAHGTGALNIDGCRVETGESLNGGRYSDNKRGDDGNTYGSGINLRSNRDYEQPLGRFPANLIHDGSDEVLAGFPSDAGAPMLGTEGSKASVGSITGERARVPGAFRSDTGSAARFFYSSKADAGDRLGSKHPTVKPIDLMQYLVRLVCPKGGTVLDPFAGTGTTGEAAWREGMRAILIEREPEYQADIARRMELADKPAKRAAVAATKNNLQGYDDLPLFIDVQGSE